MFSLFDALVCRLRGHIPDLFFSSSDRRNIGGSCRGRFKSRNVLSGVVLSLFSYLYRIDPLLLRRTIDQLNFVAFDSIP